ncbi:hypothetical protein BH20CHL4_BH20CHL4_15590 [soil metagenome]
MNDRIDNANDKAGGKLDELTGRGKQAVGDATGDEQMHDEGVKDEVTGKAKQVLGDIKDKIKDVTDKVAD